MLRYLQILVYLPQPPLPSEDAMLNLKYLTLLLATLLTLAACAEPLNLDDLKQVCLPNDPQCAQENYDGDGVKNRDDDFPTDPACSKRGAEHCSACSVGCGDDARCDLEVGVCVARELEACDGVDNDFFLTTTQPHSRMIW